MSEKTRQGDPDVTVLGSDQYFSTDHLMDSIGGRTARGGLVTFVSHGLKFAVSILATAVLARLLTPKDYGLIGMVAVVTGFVSMFKDLGLSLATVQTTEISFDQISTLFWINVGLSGLIFLIMVAGSPVVAWFYGEPRLLSITLFTSFGFILGGLSVQHEALLKRQMRFFTLSAIALLSMTFGYAVGIAMAWYGMSYWALVFSQLSLLGANTLLLWALCKWRPGRPKRDSNVRNMLAFGGNVTGYSTVNYFSKNTDMLLIGRFWGPSQLGFYGKATQIVGLPTDQVLEPVSSVVIPALSRLSGDPERYRQAYRRMVEKVLMFTMPAVVLMIATSDWLVQILLGSQWVGMSAILVFMGVAYLFQPIVSTGGWLLVTQGRTKEMLRWSLISAPVSILSIVIGVRWGALGVAACYSVARVLVINPLMYWYVGRSGPVRTIDFYRLLAPFTGAAIVGILACLMFRMTVPVHNPVIGVTVCAILVGIANLTVLLAVPSGRAAIVDIRSSIRLLRPVRADARLDTP